MSAAAGLAAALVAPRDVRNPVPQTTSEPHAATAAEANGGPADADGGDLAAAVAGALLEAGETALSAAALLGAGSPGAAELLGLAAAALAPAPAALGGAAAAEAPAASVLLARARVLVSGAARLAAGSVPGCAMFKVSLQEYVAPASVLPGSMYLRCCNLCQPPDTGRNTRCIIRVSRHHLCVCDWAREPWRWQPSQPLYPPSRPAQPAAAMPAAPAGDAAAATAEAVCRAAAEGVCQALAAGWQRGHRSAVQATFAPLADLAMPAGDAALERELQAGLLMLARLAALLGGSDEIARRILPLLAGSNAAAAPPAVRATAAFALACVAGACARGGCRCAPSLIPSPGGCHCAFLTRPQGSP